jgi:hypothetical protein
VQSEDTFQYDHMGRIDREDLALALMLLEGIDGDVSALGESRSYSLACARAFCSGVKDL